MKMQILSFENTERRIYIQDTKHLFKCQIYFVGLTSYCQGYTVISVSPNHTVVIVTIPDPHSLPKNKQSAYVRRLLIRINGVQIGHLTYKRMFAISYVKKLFMCIRLDSWICETCFV